MMMMRTSRCHGPGQNRVGVARPHPRPSRLRVAEPAVTPLLQEPKKDPFEERTSYTDGFVDRFFIKLFTRKIAEQMGPDVVAALPAEPTYEDWVRLGTEVVRGGTTEEQHDVARGVLVALLPPGTATLFRTLFPPNQIICELAALVASSGFYWLVGESEIQEVEVMGEDGQLRKQRSLVKIKKCRYLENSGCVGMCVNMCKIPTQSFFTDECGLPTTMKPNFEDLSCEMIFGVRPPPLREDAAYNQPCFAMQSSVLAGLKKSPTGGPCPKVDTQRFKALQRAAREEEAAAAAAAAAAAPLAAAEAVAVPVDATLH